MSDAVFIQSLLDGDVIDVEGAKAKAGTPLDVFPPKFPPGDETPPTAQQLAAAANQLWTFVDGPIADSFFIQSQLGQDLVFDIEGGKAEPGAALQVYTKKPTSTAVQIDEAKNQLWTWLSIAQPEPPGALHMTYYMIQSVLDANLVVDVTKASTGPGTLLQVYTKKPTGTTAQFNDAKNQLWSEVPTYIPQPK
jgi:hypothetical protein